MTGPVSDWLAGTTVGPQPTPEDNVVPFKKSSPVQDWLEGPDHTPAIEQSLGASPDEEAKKRKLSEQSGLPYDAVDAAPAEVQRLVRKQQIDNLVKDAPLTREWLADPLNASVAHDDVESLTQIEDTWTTSNILTGMSEAAQRSLAGIGDFALSLAQDLEKNPNRQLGPIEQYIKDTFTDWSKLNDKPGHYVPSLTFEEMNTDLTNWLNPLKLIQYGGERALTSVPSMVEAVFSPGTFMMGLTGDIAQSRAQNDGRTQATTEDMLRALPAAVISAQLERLGAVKLFKGNPFKGIFGEGVTEAGQSLVEYTGETAATEKGFDAPTAAMQTLQGFVDGILAAGVQRGAVDTYIKAVDKLRQTTTAKVFKQRLDKTQETLANSALTPRDPAAAMDHFSQVGPKTTYLSVDGITELANKLELSPVDLAQQLGIRQQFEKEYLRGGDIQLSAEQLGQLMLNEEWSLLSEHIRETEDSFTLREAEEYEKTGLKEEIEGALKPSPILTFKAREQLAESKIKTSSGEPIQVYHGTMDDFEQFSTEHLGKATRASSAKYGFFFSDNPNLAASYTLLPDATYREKNIWNTLNNIFYLGQGEKVVETISNVFLKKSLYTPGANIRPVYLDIRNPLIVEYNDGDYRDRSFTEVIQTAKDQGYDGVIMKNVRDPGYDESQTGIPNKEAEKPSTVYIAFHPSQIISSISAKTIDNIPAEIDVTAIEKDIATDGIFQTSEEAGMTATEYMFYLASLDKAHKAAVNRQNEKLLKDAQRKVSKEYKKLRKDMREGVRESLTNSPVYQAINSIQKDRLDRAAVAAILGDEKYLDQLPKQSKGRPIYTNKGEEGGIDPSVVAEIHGFDTASDMLLAMMTALPFDQAVEQTTDQMMQRQYPDLTNEKLRLDAALESLHNDATSEVLVQELNKLRELATEKKTKKAEKPAKEAKEKKPQTEAPRFFIPNQQYGPGLRNLTEFAPPVSEDSRNKFFDEEAGEQALIDDLDIALGQTKSFPDISNKIKDVYQALTISNIDFDTQIKAIKTLTTALTFAEKNNKVFFSNQDVVLNQLELLIPALEYLSASESLYYLSDEELAKTQDKYSKEKVTDPKIAALHDIMIYRGASPDTYKKVYAEYIKQTEEYTNQEARKKELKAAVKLRKIKRNVLKNAIKRQLNNTPIKDVRVSRFVKTAKEQGKLAGKLLRKGDVEGAIDAKFKQLTNFIMAQQAYKVKAETEKQNKKLNQLATRKRNKLPQSYYDMIRQKLSDYNIGPKLSEKTRKRMQDWVARKTAEGAIFQIPPQLLSDQKKHWQDMTIAEWRDLVDAVKNIEAQGRLQKQSTALHGKVEFEHERAVLLKQAENIPDTARAKRAEKSAVKTYKDKIAAGIAAFDAAIVKMENLLRELDGETVGPWWEAFYKRFSRAETEKLDMMEKHVRPIIQDAFKQLPKKVLSRMNKKVFVPSLGKEYTYSQLLKIALNMGNPSNISKMLDGHNEHERGKTWTQQDLIDAMALLSPEEARWVQRVWDQLESFRPAVERVYEAEMGIAAERIPIQPVVIGGVKVKGGYFPMQYAQTPTFSTPLEAMQDPLIRAGIFSGMTKERTKFSAPIDLDLNGMINALEQQIHFITHYEAVRNVNKLLNDKEITRIIRDKLGEEYLNEFKSWYSAVASGGMKPGSNDPIDIGTEIFRTNMTAAALGGNLITIGSQVLGAFSSISQMAKPIKGDKGYSSWRGMSAFAKGGWIYATKKNAVKDATALSGVIRHRIASQDRDMRENMNKLKGKTDLKSRWNRMMMLTISGMQLYSVDIPTWIGAYNLGLKDGLSVEKAIDYADNILTTSQGSGHIKDLSALQRERGLKRALTMFSTWTFIQYNLQRDIVKSAKKFPVDAFAKSVWITLAPAVLAAWMRGNFGPDDEEDETWAGWLAQVFLGYNLGSVPVVGQWIGAVSQGYDFSFTPIQRIPDSLEKMLESVSKIFDEDEELDYKDISNIVKGTGYTLGIGGTTTAGRMFDALNKAEEEDVDWWEYITGPSRK